MFLIFDTETTGLPKRWDVPLSDGENWPRCIQIAWQIHDSKGELIAHKDYLIQPEGFTIPFDSEKVHGISTALAKEQGTPLEEVLDTFNLALEQVEYLVGHNVSFDRSIVGAEYLRLGRDDILENLAIVDTCSEETANLCKLPGGRGGRFKLPTLGELYYFLFKESFQEAHNATADVEATSRAFFELLRQDQLHPNSLKNNKSLTDELKERKKRFDLIGLSHQNLKNESAKLNKHKLTSNFSESPPDLINALSEAPFVHLHNHSQFSVLHATSRVNHLVEAASADRMPAVALTDHANLMGAFHFIKATSIYNENVEEELKIKPIVGCEFYVCDDHKDKTRRDNGYQIVFLAKNKEGYHNLAKLSSSAYLDGFYYVPRIDRKLVETYKENLIVLSGNTYGEVPSKILNLGNNQAEDALKWWHRQFGDDFYIELMRHGEEG